MKEVLISIPIYKAKLIVFTGTVEEINKRIKRSAHYDKENPKEYDSTGSAGRCFFSEGYYGIVWVKSGYDKKHRLGILVHELYHYCNRLLALKGVYDDENHDEPQAYLLEYLFLEAVKKLKW